MTDTERVDPPWEPPGAGTETEHLVKALDRQRYTFRWKADALDENGLRLRIGASSLSLGGLLKHLALVEDKYFSWHLGQENPGEPWLSAWRAGAWEQNPDWEFTSADDDSAATLYALYDAAVARSRAQLTAALAQGGLDQLVDLGWSNGDRANLRRMLCDLIEEYGRHTGHADLLREAVDGLTGEDPPQDWRPTSPTGSPEPT